MVVEGSHDLMTVLSTFRIERIATDDVPRDAIVCRVNSCHVCSLPPYATPTRSSASPHTICGKRGGCRSAA